MKTNTSKNASTRKNEKSAKTPKVSCTMALNAELNGVELKFTGKPSDGIRSGLKSAGFRWHSSKELWYAKQTADTLAIAKALSEGSVDGAEEKPSKKASKETAKKPSKKASKEPQPKAVKVEQKALPFECKSKPKVSKKLLNALNKTEGLVAEMDRDWLWVSGDTRSYSESLKALGFRFSGRRQAWYLA